jgi:hypothetical protein
VDEKPNEIPAVRDLLKAFTSLASAVIMIDAMHVVYLITSDRAASAPQPGHQPAAPGRPRQHRRRHARDPQRTPKLLQVA